MMRTAEPPTVSDPRPEVTEMFARIAPVYDRANGLMSLGRHRAWRALAVRSLLLPPGGSALDVCCGTGEFLPLLRRAVGPQGRVAGIDLCAPMLEQAAKRAEGAELVVGDACQLPFGDGEFDGLTIGWGLRNVPDLARALAEARRVLRPGGRLATLEMARRPAPVRAGVRAMTGLVGTVFRQREAYRYLDRTAASFLSAAELEAAFRQAGFRETGFRRLALGAVALHWGKA